MRRFIERARNARSRREASAPETSLGRKILLSLMLVGATGATFGSGTFASYTASTTHGAGSGNSTFDTGSLILSNLTPVTNTTCFSSSSGDGTGAITTNDRVCDSFFTLSDLRPDMATQTINLTLENEGALNAGSMTLTATCTDVDDPSQTYNGGGSLCAEIGVTILDTTPATDVCLYDDNNAGTTCTMSYTKSLTALTSAEPTLSALNAGAVKTLTIAIDMDTAAPATVMGVQANFSFTWALAQ